jgi:tetratricopeptide (TPR) repeat protein
MGFFNDLFKKSGMPDKINFAGKNYEVIPDAMVFSRWGLDKYNAGDYKGAVVDFSLAINAHPENQNFYLMRGTAYEDMGDDIEAEKDFKRAIELENTGSVSTYRLGMLYSRKKDFENAIKWLKVSYENAIDVNLDHLGLGNNNIFFVAKKVIAGNLGNFLTQIKRIDEGFEYLEEAIKIDPNYSNPYIVKGLVLAQMGNPKDGIHYLKKAVSLGNTQAGMMLKMLEDLIQKEEAEARDELELDFVFRSSDHIRYENGLRVSGPHGSAGAPRAIKIEANITGKEGYTATIFAINGEQAVIQMAPKQMKLIKANNKEIQIRGYGKDEMGSSFADYGISIFHEEGRIAKCVLHMYDRNIDIEYM